MNEKTIWNPLKKGFWEKENLFKDWDKKKENLKQVREEEKARHEKVKQKTKGITGLGIKLTFMITVPLFLTLFLGIFGLILGAIIFFITLATMKK